MTGPFRVLIMGAGDLATGVAHRLYRAGFEVVMTEFPEPLAVRRTVAFAECVFRGRWSVEGVWAAKVDTAEEALRLMGAKPGVIPVIVDPEGWSRRVLETAVLVDARMPSANWARPGKLPGWWWGWAPASRPVRMCTQWWKRPGAITWVG